MYRRKQKTFAILREEARSEPLVLSGEGMFASSRPHWPELDTPSQCDTPWSAGSNHVLLESCWGNFTSLMKRSNQGQRNLCLLSCIRHSQSGRFQGTGACKPSMGFAYLGIAQVRRCSQFPLWKSEQKPGLQSLSPLLAAWSSFKFPPKTRVK